MDYYLFIIIPGLAPSGGWDDLAFKADSIADCMSNIRIRNSLALRLGLQAYSWHIVHEGKVVKRGKVTMPDRQIVEET